MSNLASWVREKGLEEVRIQGLLLSAGTGDRGRQTMLDGEKLCSAVVEHVSRRPVKAEWLVKRASYRRLLVDSAVSDKPAAEEYRKKAREDFEQSIRLDPAKADPFVGRALSRCCQSGGLGSKGCAGACDDSGQRDAAIADLREAARRDPGLACAAWLQARDWSEAAGDAESAVVYLKAAQEADAAVRP